MRTVQKYIECFMLLQRVFMGSVHSVVDTVVCMRRRKHAFVSLYKSYENGERYLFKELLL